MQMLNTPSTVRYCTMIAKLAVLAVAVLLLCAAYMKNGKNDDSDSFQSMS